MSIILHGVAIGGGIAIGQAHLLTSHMSEVTHYFIEDEILGAEINRFEIALDKTLKQLEALREDIPENSPAEIGAFLSLHIMLLNDESIAKEPVSIIRSQHCNAEWALKLCCDEMVEQFDEMEDAYFRERKHDVMQVIERVIKNLDTSGIDLFDVPTWDESTILVAHDLSPADMMFFKDTEVAAFITDIGGATSHTAILGRSLELPSVIALHRARELIREGEDLIVDGILGVVIINPEESVLLEYRQRKEEWLVSREKLSLLKTQTTLTLDGTQIKLLGNIELPGDVSEVLEIGAQGIGLFRSEFLFLGRDNLPSEEEQYQAYKTVAIALNGLPVTVRTMDLGADKNPKWLTAGKVENPALGLTGIRLCLAEPLMFREQLRALLRASNYGPLKILFPMIHSVSELKQAISQLDYAKQELDERGISYDKNVEVGAMIEIPAAALVVGSLLKCVDFISIGTNDLIQYTLAIDRSDDSVSHLYDPIHPAVLKLVSHAIHVAIRQKAAVTVCGEMAGDPKLTRLLLGMGLRSFSMHPARLLDVKQQVLNSDLDLIETIVAKMLRTEDPDKVIDYLQQLNSV